MADIHNGNLEKIIEYKIGFDKYISVLKSDLVFTSNKIDKNYFPKYYEELRINFVRANSYFQAILKSFAQEMIKKSESDI